ncbi:MAG: transglutaminase-like domain-containing protein [Burkholderiales bacterium]
MSRLAKDGRKNPVIRDTAARLVQGLSSKNYSGEIGHLFDFVRDKIRYTRDIDGVETLHFPEVVLEQGYGDCDDKAVLLASLLGAIGHRTRFIAVGFEPGNYSHVLTQVQFGNGKWLSLDPTENRPIGWFPPNVRATMIRVNN